MNNHQFTQPSDIPQRPPISTEEISTPVVTEPPKPPRRKTLFLVLGGFIFTAVVAGLLLGFYFSYSRKAEVPVWQGVRPSITTKEEVIKTLGAPIKEKQTPLGNTLLYPSDNKVFPNTILFDKEDKVTSIFIQVPTNDPIKFSEWLQDYGQPKKEMYNSYSAFTKTYIFPNKGVAVVANKEADQIYSIHYFQPTNLEDYLSQWDNYLFEESPYKM